MFRKHAPDYPIFIGLLVLLVWAPIPLNSDYDWSQAVLMAGTFALALVWLLLYLKRRVQLTPAFTSAWPAFACLLWVQLWSLVQLLPVHGYLGRPMQTIALVPQVSLHMWVMGLCLLVAFALVTLLVRTEQRLRLLLWVLVLGGVFQSVFGSLMVLSGVEYSFFVPKPGFIGSNVGTMIYRNAQAGYLVLCLCAGIGLMIADMKGGVVGFKSWLTGLIKAAVGGKGALRVCLVIVVAGLVMTKSRMGNMSFGLALGLVGALYLLARKDSRKAGLIFLASILLIDILVLGTFFDLEQLSDRLQQTDLETESRMNTNAMAWQAVKDYWLLGTGLGSFVAVFPAYQQGSLGMLFVHAHNDYLQFWLELGLIGSLGLLGFWLVTAGQAVRSLVYSEKSLERGVAFGVLMLMVAILLHSLVDFNLQYAGYAFSFCVFSASLWAARGLKRRASKSLQASLGSEITQLVTPASQAKPKAVKGWRLPKRWPGLLALLPLLLLLGYAAQVFRADLLFWQNHFQQLAWQASAETLPAGEIDQMKGRYARALELRPGNPEYLESLAWLSFWQATQAADNTQATARLREALDFLNSAQIAMPTWPRTHARMAYIKALLGEVDDGFAFHFDRAFNLGPWFGYSLALLAETGVATWPLLNATQQEQTRMALVRSVQLNRSRLAPARQMLQASPYRQAICEPVGALQPQAGSAMLANICNQPTTR